MFFCDFYIFPTLSWAFSYTFPTIYNYSQPPFVGAVGMVTLRERCPFPEGSNKLAEGGAIKSVNVLLVGD